MADLTQETTLKTLAGQFGLAVAQGGMLYLPVIKQMSLTELSSWIDTAFNKKDTDAALKKLHDAMTPEQLADEKEKLAGLTTAMANSNAQAWNVAKDLMTLVMQAGMRALLLAAGGL